MLKLFFDAFQSMPNQYFVFTLPIFAQENDYTCVIAQNATQQTLEPRFKFFHYHLSGNNMQELPADISSALLLIEAAKISHPSFQGFKDIFNDAKICYKLKTLGYTEKNQDALEEFLFYRDIQIAEKSKITIVEHFLHYMLGI